MLAALVLPADLIDKINSLSTLSPGTPKVEVLVNEENPLKAQTRRRQDHALLAQANLAIAKRIATEGGHYLNLLIEGGELASARQRDRHPRPASDSAQILEALRPALPPGAAARLARRG